MMSVLLFICSLSIYILILELIKNERDKYKRMCTELKLINRKLKEENEILKMGVMNE